MAGEDRPGKYADTGDMRFEGEVKTPFAAEEDVDSMKDMLIDAKPEQVFNVADAWMAVHDRLAGGDGSIKRDLDRAVEQVLEHWAGEAADEFAKRARKLSKQIADCATYAGYVSVAMRNAGESLNKIKPQIDALEKPGTLRAMNTLGDGLPRGGGWTPGGGWARGGGWRGGITGAPSAQGAYGAHGSLGAQESSGGHDGHSPTGRSTQLKAAALMELLAMTYSSQTKTMESWRRPVRAERQDPETYPGHPGGVAPVPVDGTPGRAPRAATPGSSASGSPVGRTAPKPTRRGGTDVNSGTGTALSGRSTSGTAPSSTSSPGTPAASTRTDGISGGTATGPRPGNTSPGAPAGGASGREPTAGSSPGAAGGVPGGLGSAGRAAGNRGLMGKGIDRTDPGKAGTGGRGTGVGRAIGAGTGADGAAHRGPAASREGLAPETPQKGKGSAQPGGRHGLHFSRGGTRTGDRDRNGNGVIGGGVPEDNFRPTKYDRNPRARQERAVEDDET